MNYGATANCSMIEQDGKYEIGFHFQNTNGIDVDRTISGENLQDMVEDLIYDVFDEITEQQAINSESESEEEENEIGDEEYIAQLEQMIEDLTAENDSLKIDNEILQRRADDAVNKTMKKKDRPRFSVETDSDLIDYLIRFF